MNNELTEFWADRELEKKIGDGPNGEVYLESYKDLDEKRYCAAKIIKLPGDLHSLEKLEKDRPEDITQESWLHRIASEIGHKLNKVKLMRGSGNVAFLEDYKIIKKKDGYVVYIRTELLTSAQEFIQNGAQNKETALRFCIQISDAVRQYEKAGLLHRNIKPSNIFIDNHGDFKLADPAFFKLGISNPEFGCPEEINSPNGSVAGEIYSICACVMKLFEPSGRLLAICQKAMNPDPQKRFNSLDSFQKALMKADQDSMLAVYEPSTPSIINKEKKKRSRMALIGMFILGAALVACAVLYARLALLFITNTPPGNQGSNINDEINLTVTNDSYVMPDLVGKNAEKALRAFTKAGIKSNLIFVLDSDKNGIVIKQNVPPLTETKSSEVIWLLAGCNDPANVTDRIESISLPQASISLKQGESKTLNVTKDSAEAQLDTLVWSSSDENVVSCQNGTLRANTKGEATITVKDITGFASASIKVSVTDPSVLVPDVVGMTEDTAEEYLIRNGFSVKFEYEYSDIEIYTVIRQNPPANTELEEGSEITLAVSMGAEDEDRVPVTDITLNVNSIELNGGESYQLIATVYPKDATNQMVSWLTSDKDVVSVSSDGELYAKGNGVATVRAITADGSKVAYCTVTVKTFTYTVIYDANGGEGTMEPSTHIYGISKKLNDCTFTMKGASFAGWSPDPLAKEPKFINMQTVGNLTKEDGATVTLYAVWQATSYFVSYDARGGTLEEEMIPVTYGRPFGQLATPVREGWEFDGWYSNPENGFLITSSSIVNMDTPSTIYAHWRKLSDFVNESQAPQDAEIINTRYSYTLTEQKTVSAKQNQSGWTLVSEGLGWLPIKTETVSGVVFGDNFDSSNSLYSKYKADIPQESQGYTEKVSYNKVNIDGYIYYHWTESPNGTVSSRPVSDVMTSSLTNFSAFESKTPLPTTDANGESNNGLFFANRKFSPDVSWWWYRLPIRTVTYTVSQWSYVYNYNVVSTETSETDPSGGENVSNVEKMVQYYIYD